MHAGTQREDRLTCCPFAAIGLNAQQELTITVPSCSGGVGKLDVKFHGGASWLYNLFSGSIAGDQ